MNSLPLRSRYRTRLPAGPRDSNAVTMHVSPVTCARRPVLSSQSIPINKSLVPRHTASGNAPLLPWARNSHLSTAGAGRPGPRLPAAVVVFLALGSLSVHAPPCMQRTRTAQLLHLNSPPLSSLLSSRSSGTWISHAFNATSQQPGESYVVQQGDYAWGERKETRRSSLSARTHKNKEERKQAGHASSEHTTVHMH